MRESSEGDGLHGVSRTAEGARRELSCVCRAGSRLVYRMGVFYVVQAERTMSLVINYIPNISKQAFQWMLGAIDAEH